MRNCSPLSLKSILSSNMIFRSDSSLVIGLNKKILLGKFKRGLYFC